MLNEKPHSIMEISKNDPWLLFLPYKTSGQGLAEATPDYLSFSHLDEATRQRDTELLTKKKTIRTDRRTPDNNTGDPGAFVFENFLSSETVRQRWLGDQAAKTTEYDDWISGVDLVAEWESVDSLPVRLAIDFTVTSNEENLQKKIEKVGKKIRIKYFRSKIEKDPQGHPLETSSLMPMVVIGVNQKILRAIAENGRPITHEHPLRLILLHQAKAQIDWHLGWLVLKVLEKHQKINKKVKELRQTVHDHPLLSATDYQRLFAEVPEIIWTRFMSKNDQQMLNDLVRVKQKLDEEIETAKNIQIDPELTALLATSPTNNRLSNF